MMWHQCIHNAWIEILMIVTCIHYACLNVICVCCKLLGKQSNAERLTLFHRIVSAKLDHTLTWYLTGITSVKWAETNPKGDVKTQQTNDGSERIVTRIITVSPLRDTGHPELTHHSPDSLGSDLSCCPLPLLNQQVSLLWEYPHLFLFLSLWRRRSGSFVRLSQPWHWGGSILQGLSAVVPGNRRAWRSVE